MSYLITFIEIIFNLLGFAIIARVLLSWVNPGLHHPVMVFLRDVTEPILGFFRKIIPPIGMLDLSPLVAVIALDILKSILISIIAQI